MANKEIIHGNHAGVAFTVVGEEVRATTPVTESIMTTATLSGGVWTRTLTSGDAGKVIQHEGAATVLSVPLLPAGFTATFIGTVPLNATVTVDVTGAYAEQYGAMSFVRGEDRSPIAVTVSVTTNSFDQRILHVVGSGGEPAPNTQSGVSYQLALSDAFRVVLRDNASANTTTVPVNASVAFATGTVIPIVQRGAGVSTITAAAGVLLNGVDGGSFAIDARYQMAALLKVGTNAWNLSGSI